MPVSSPAPVRVTFLCHAATAAMRAGRFPRPDDPLDAASEAALRQISFRAATRHRCCTSPARRAVDTAAALRLAAAPEPLLDDVDPGRWAGLSLQHLALSEPDGVAAWLERIDAAPHGGETFAAVAARVARWLDRQNAGTGVVAVTHATVVRAALALILEAPLASMLRIDVAPLSLTRLSGSPGRWRLCGLNLPLGDAT